MCFPLCENPWSCSIVIIFLTTYLVDRVLDVVEVRRRKNRIDKMLCQYDKDVSRDWPKDALFPSIKG